MKNLRNFFRLTAAALVSGAMMLSCLNPIGFDPAKPLLMVDIRGEISIDSVNSAEIQIRNHTKSIDISKIDIRFINSGANPAVDSIAARITGAPVAGTQESILLRPITADVNTRYQLKFWYHQAASCPSELLQSAHTGWDYGGRDPDKTFEITELPRGKYVIHLYRKTSGDIGIAIEEKPGDMTEMGDNHLDQDFVTNVKVSNVIDLSGAEINLNMPSSGVNVNTNVSFSNEARVMFEALIDAIESNRTYPNGYGAVVVRNHTSEQLTDIVFTQGGSTHGMPLVRPDDQDWFILGKGKWETTLRVNGVQYGPKNALIENQGKTFLHVYKNKNGGYSFIISEKEWTGDLILSLPAAGQDAPDSSYSFTVNVNLSGGGQIPANKGALYIHNMTTKVLDNPDPGKMHIVSRDLNPVQTFDLTVGAKATLGGVVDPSNYTVSVGTKATSVFVSHMTPTHVYYYKTTSGGYDISDHWPPADADLGGIWDGIELGDDQGAILIKNRSDYILDYFTWLSTEYRIELTSGDDYKQVVTAGTSPIGFKIRNGSYGEFVTRTINPGQTLVITVQGQQIIDVTPPLPPEPPVPPAPPPPAYTEHKVMKFYHETGYRTPIEYLILYRDTGDVNWKNDTANGYPGTGSGIYYMYQRGKDATVAPNNKDMHVVLPALPSNYGPYKGNFKAAPIHGLDDSLDDPINPTHLFDAIANSDKATLLGNGKIAVGSLGNLGNLAVKVKGDVVTPGLPWNSQWTGTALQHGKNHQALEITDSVIIQFDPPLKWHESYQFKLATEYTENILGTSVTRPVNWFVAWIGSNHEAVQGIRYSGGYDDLAWFIMRPDKRVGAMVNMYARGVGMKYQ